MNQKRLKLVVSILVSLLLALSFTYVLLDTFVMEKRFQQVSSGLITSSAKSDVSIKTYRGNDTTIYVASLSLDDGQLIESKLAKNTYGRNIIDKTSHMAEEVGASLAINGDYYGARSSGYVVRNGELLRDKKRSNSQEDMVIWSNGSMSVIKEADFTAQELVKKGAMQVMSFGPGLVVNSKISVSVKEEVDRSMASNPRTAVGYMGGNDYIFVVADGRTKESKGLSLLQLARFMKDLGVKEAYNLDGGGSSVMYFDGKIVNRPTTYGDKLLERKISDILYVK